LSEEANMKRQKLNLLLIVLVSILVIPLGLSCEGTTNPNNNSRYEWGNCPGELLAENISIRVEDLPSGWYLWYVQTGPTCEYPFSINNEAFVEMTFWDKKPWNAPRRRVSNNVYLRWEEQAVTYYFFVPEDMVAINMTGVDEAYIKVESTQVGEPPVNCTYGVSLRFRKGLYEVHIGSYDMDLEDLCIKEGEEVDAEVAFVTDLATKVASRIP